MSSTGTPLILIFDSSCAHCSRVAIAVRESARKPIEVVSIRDHRAGDLRQQYLSDWLEVQTIPNSF